ncbi:unnamed protein product [Psylliodes chrysocephalus]|uniref:Uncharacterized protein n=1 Tax=Psylliodes chrysocephalus TaxID=3402493 RepID=A0A9P0GE37_9CUCU|nr:unnamed protein product [Psylliodes chrysocephala]
MLVYVDSRQALLTLDRPRIYLMLVLECHEALAEISINNVVTLRWIKGLIAIGALTEVEGQNPNSGSATVPTSPPVVPQAKAPQFTIFQPIEDVVHFFFPWFV